MASSESSEVMAGVRRFASVFVEHNNLAPPLPIEDIVARYSSIEYVHLPGAAEAVLVTRRDGRPRLLLDPRIANSNRRRFTLAHELGHLLLPWQFGTMICHKQSILQSAESATLVEQEANVFASSILVPDRWVEANTGGADGRLAEFVVEASEIAQVSPITSAIAIARASGRSVAIWLTLSNEREYMMQSPTCPLLRGVGFAAAKSELQALGANLTEASVGPYTIRAAEFDCADVELDARQGETSKSILRAIFDDLGIAEAKRSSIYGQVHGVIGKANNDLADAAPLNFFRFLLARFAGRANLAAITNHTRFREFLSQKVRELRVR